MKMERVKGYDRDRLFSFHTIGDFPLFFLHGTPTTLLRLSFEDRSLQSGAYLTSVGTGERLLRSLPVPTIMEVNRR